MARLLRALRIVVGGLLIAAAGVLLGMRLKVPFVVNGVRKMNRAVMNPRQMRSAGTPGAYAAVIRHVGRNSGREYETPIGITPYQDGYVVALPYGRETDWLKNLMAAGTATIVYEGETITVSRPRLVPIETLRHAFSPADQRAHRAFGVSDCLLMHRSD